MRMLRHTWGMFVIFLGVWEASAYATRKHPTITGMVHRSHARNRHVTRVLLAAWMVALAKHLLRDLEREEGAALTAPSAIDGV